MRVALQEHGRRGNDRPLRLRPGGVHRHQHLRLEQPLWVCDRAAHLHGARARVHFTGHQHHSAAEYAIGPCRRAHRQPRARLHNAHIALRKVERDPQLRRVADHEQRREQRRRVGEHLIGANFLTGTEVALDHDAAQRRLQREHLVDRRRVDAVERQASLGPLLLGAPARHVGLGRLHVLLRHHAVPEQVGEPRQRPLGERKIGRGPARVRLRLAEVGGCDRREYITGAHGLPRVDRHVDYPPGERRENPHRDVLVPHHAPVESHGLGNRRRRRDRGQRRELGAALGQDHARPLDARDRRGISNLTRRCLAVPAARERDCQQQAKGCGVDPRHGTMSSPTARSSAYTLTQ